MLNLGPGEIIFIVVAALLVLGPQRLPELARGIGKFMAEFRRHTSEVRTVMEREFYEMDRMLEEKKQEQAALPDEVLAAHGELPEDHADVHAIHGDDVVQTSEAPPHLAAEPPGEGTEVTDPEGTVIEPPSAEDPLARREPVPGAIARESKH